MATSSVTNGFAAALGLKSPSKRSRVQSRRSQVRVHFFSPIEHRSNERRPAIFFFIIPPESATVETNAVARGFPPRGARAPIPRPSRSPSGRTNTHVSSNTLTFSSLNSPSPNPQTRGVRTCALGPDGRDQPWHDGHKNDHDGKADPLYFPPPRSPDDLSRRAASGMNTFDIPGTGASINPPQGFTPGDAANTPPHANPGGAVNRGVCWSNLQDLDDVPADDAVYILVFGAGTGSEGLYSLQERTKDDVPVDIILAFPTHEDAARYGTLLEAEMGRVPVVEAARPEDLKYTCREGGYRCKVARRGVLLMPPEKTVEVTDWERTNALRQGQWSVQGFEEHTLSDMDAQAIASDETRVKVMSADDFKAQYEAVCGDVEDDEACVLPEDFDEESAREQLMKMFNRDDWGGEYPGIH